MLTKEQAGDIFDRIRRFSSADEVEVSFTGARFALTRFANNVIHQNVEDENLIVSVRTSFDGRTARATANQFDDASLKRAVESSEALARVQEKDPDLLAMPDAIEGDGSTSGRADRSAPPHPAKTGPDGGPVVRATPTPTGGSWEMAVVANPTTAGGGARATRPPSQAPSRFFEQTAAITPGDRADAVAEIVNIARRHSLTTAGIYSSAESLDGIFNSRGLAKWHRQTLAEVSITMLGADSSGWQKLNSANVRNLRPKELAEIAAQKAVDSAHPRETPPGKYTVILEPSAALDIIGFMFWDFGGMAILDQRSFLNDRIGTRLFGENINIWDDVAHPLQTGCPFDGEGIRRRRVPLVENGIVKRVVYARGTAARMKKSEYVDKVGVVEATGHGFPLPNEMGEMPMNIVIGGGDKPQTVDEMIASTERGLLVTRLWYIREVDPYEKIVTGMTRDGTFLIENGRVRGGLRNFRFNESLIRMLSNVECLGTPVRASGEESFDMVVPAMKIKDFNFTEVTKF